MALRLGILGIRFLGRAVKRRILRQNEKVSSSRGVAGASEDTRLELLRAGAKLIRERGHAPGIDIRLVEVAEAAGRTTGSAYQLWDTQAEYQEALAVYMAENIEYARSDVLEAEVRAAIEDGATLPDLVRRAGETYFRGLVGSTEFYVGLHFWTSLNAVPESVQAAKVASYTEIQHDFESFFGAVFAHFGDEWVADEPTISELTTLVNGMTEGLALRHRFAGSRKERERIVELYLGFLDMLLSRVKNA